MKILRNKLKNELNLRTEKNYPKEGIEFIDINPLVMQKETLREMTDLFAENAKGRNVDYVVGPEARGFFFTTVALRINAGFIPVRKKGKLPPSTIQESFEYEKEYGSDTLELPKLVNESYRGKNFYIIDDIYATGNTMKAIIEGIEKLGGNVVGTGVIMNIVELNNNKDVFSLIDINEE